MTSLLTCQRVLRFTNTLAKNILQEGVLDNIKRELCDSCALENGQSAPKIQAYWKRTIGLCAMQLTPGVGLSVSNNKLGLHLTQESIDRSHRRGRGAGRGRGAVRGGGVTVLIATVMTQLVCHARLLSSRPTTRASGNFHFQTLKGSKLITAEDLTRRRAELLTRHVHSTS